MSAGIMQPLTELTGKFAVYYILQFMNRWYIAFVQLTVGNLEHQ
jgi:hypothetical protein